MLCTKRRFLDRRESVDEKVELRIFNPDFNGMSTEDLQDLIEHADLPSLGYKKISEKKTQTDFETGT